MQSSHAKEAVSVCYLGGGTSRAAAVETDTTTLRVRAGTDDFYWSAVLLMWFWKSARSALIG